MKFLKLFIIPILFLALQVNAQNTQAGEMKVFIDDLMGQMTLEEKIDWFFFA